MAATGVVGDAACTMSAVGEPDPSLIPAVGTIAVGRSGNYTCLIW